VDLKDLWEVKEVEEIQLGAAVKFSMLK